MAPAELEAFVDGLVDQAMRRDHVAGAVVAVVQNGQVVLNKGYGLDRLQPARQVDPGRTLFRLGEITQDFTWISLMREIEAGHIRLDAPVNVYLPQRDQVRDQGYKRPVTIRDLMTQSPGFEDRVLGQLIERNPDRIRPLDVYLSQERPRRVRPPGALATNSPYGAALAGEALVQVTGKTPEALLESEISGPLGLARTTLREPYPPRDGLPAPMSAALARDVSQGFHWTGAAYAARPFEYFTQLAPAMSASTTASDMARLMLAGLADGSLDGAVVYSPAIARDFRTAAPAPAPGAAPNASGLMQYDLPGGFHGYGRDGSTLSFRARMITIPQLGLGVFVAANTDTSAPLVTGLAGQLVQRFYAAPPAPAQESSEWLRDNASAFSGVYLTTARAYHGLEGFVDRLRGLARVKVSPDGVLVAPAAGGVARWVPDEGSSLDQPQVRFHAVDGVGALAFDIQSGQARRWFAPSGLAAYERVGFLFSRTVLIAAAAATVIGALGALAGLFLRDRRDFRQTSIQGRADAAQLSASVLWIAAVACFAAWALSAKDAARAMFGWPDARLVIGSSCALVATIMTVVVLGLLPVAWRGGRRLDSWTTGRKARFTATTLIFCLFAVLLGMWGALEPWSG
jgi:CubicO group peptidase (beta-lactamase class C family)